MSMVIEIKKEMIGAETTNSVNSRELWTNLGIKKQFGNWIKHQIESLGLEENTDYVTFTQKVNRQTLKEYVLTLDMAKHIAMASRTEKGKEVRKYFIEAEKKLTQVQTQQNDILPAIVEMAKVNQQIVQSNQELISNITEMNKGLHQMLAGFANMQQDLKTIKRDVVIINGGLNMCADQTIKIRETQDGLHPKSIDLIREYINNRAKVLCDGTDTNFQSITRAIYSYINSEFGVSSYYHLKNVDLEGALKMIENINIKA